jgi:hypothetical protein
MLIGQVRVGASPATTRAKFFGLGVRVESLLSLLGKVGYDDI